MNYSKSINKYNLGFKTPAIMGILNITPDSFSDGGRYFSKPKIAIDNALKMKKMGADIIDIGAESTRPGAITISPDEEIKTDICNSSPYKDWNKNITNLPEIYDEEPKEEVSDEDLISKLQSFGYTTETMQFMLLPALPASVPRPWWCLL